MNSGCIYLLHLCLLLSSCIQTKERSSEITQIEREGCRSCVSGGLGEAHSFARSQLCYGCTCYCCCFSCSWLTVIHRVKVQNLLYSADMTGPFQDPDCFCLLSYQPCFVLLPFSKLIWSLA